MSSFPRCFLGVALALPLMPVRSPAQTFYERDDVMVAAGWKDGAPITHDLTPQKTYQNPGWRAKMLVQFPDADTDNDGKLTESEAIAYHLTHVRRFTPQGGELAYLPASVSRWTDYVTMRDGQKLPVEVYLPGGTGPWPAVLIRTTRGRIDSALDYANELLRLGYAAIGGDLTPEGDFINADELGRLAAGTKEMTREERAAFNARRTRRNSAEDGADTIAWIARQPWSNGRIAMTGYSEASFQAKEALSANPPDLDLVVTEIGTLSSRLNPYLAPRGGAIDWRTGNYPRPEASQWKPEVNPLGTDLGRLIRAAVVPDVYYDDRTGWFDFAAQGAIDEWLKMKVNRKSTLIVGIGGHGRVADDARMPPDYGDADLLMPQINAFERLRDNPAPSQGSRLYYFLMGDATDPKAPGNVWKVTETWPVTHDDVSWYLRTDRSLGRERPESADAAVTYVHDPLHPVETLNGNRMPSKQYGPRDQRHLDKRDDVLLFETEPLTEVLELTGEPMVELFVSSDAPDTQFVVQLLDIYPDGYKWPIRESAVTTRFRDAGEIPSPLQPGKIYRIQIPLAATAVALAPGHRVGLQIMSSSYPTYPVHPNTWDEITSYDQSRPARQTIHLSRDRASRIVLPVLPSGKSMDYKP